MRITEKCEVSEDLRQWREEEEEDDGGERTEPRGVVWRWEEDRRPWDSDTSWLVLLMLRMMHRKARGGETDGTTGGAGGTNNSGGFSGVSSNGGGGGAAGAAGAGGGVAGPSNGGTSSKGTSSGGGNLTEMTEVDQFGYPDSPTQTWLAANADLSPLRILDNINLKSEFPYTISMDTEKPPDISNIGLDNTTANLLQFAASVPVPDHSTTFLDIGLDSFQSLYEDHLIGDLVSTASSTPTSSVTTDPSFCKLQTDCMTTQQIDLRSLGLQCVQLPPPDCLPSPHPALRSLVEPLPASALQGLIKIEPSFDPSIVKQEESSGEGGYPHMYSPDHMGPGPTSPTSGGKMKSASRKKSTASTDTEEDDISNIPSLQMRIQIIQQRVSGVIYLTRLILTFTSLHFTSPWLVKS